MKTNKKIDTAECVSEICKTLNSKNWKRKSKRISHPPDEFNVRNIWELSCKGKIFLREFTSKDFPKHHAFVWATDSEIVCVKVLTEGNNAKSKFENTEYGHQIIFSRNSPQFICPIVKLNHDGAVEYEKLDFENHEVTIHDDGHRVTIWHGGDWQMPQTVVYRLMSDGNFYME